MFSYWYVLVSICIRLFITVIYFVDVHFDIVWWHRQEMLWMNDIVIVKSMKTCYMLKQNMMRFWEMARKIVNFRSTAAKGHLSSRKYFWNLYYLILLLEKTVYDLTSNSTSCKRISIAKLTSPAHIGFFVIICVIWFMHPLQTKPINVFIFLLLSAI